MLTPQFAYGFMAGSICGVILMAVLLIVAP